MQVTVSLDHAAVPGANAPRWTEPSVGGAQVTPPHLPTTAIFDGSESLGPLRGDPVDEAEALTIRYESRLSNFGL
ncbi:hypothetical protein [Streptomyces sp. NBC_01363]|uniref:hypothetical protein n=1 Tax=Streptomyces sp. NBC_01363 TaxID=2903840 RepID=UPI002252D1DB|nr:hypothetical protein [Streptomyces sp. NBC_01363]MCX4736340.1 hypothetical protein [Streptomyces sp. NBC_01363]